MDNKSEYENNKSFDITKNEYEESDAKSLLEFLERKKKNPDYQCRSGFCGMCKVEIEEGEVEYHEEPLGFMQAKEILPCVSKPKSGKIRLKV